ncbi:MAG: TolC family protein, partial [Elusimicrobia bacterium]|nr:TolC family protein [Elusimicrobiota bacterium]
MPRLLFISVFLLIAMSSHAQEPGTGDTSVFLKEILGTALDRNPDIMTARKNWEAAKARVVAVKAWPDPMISFSKEKVPAGEKMDHLRLEQEIPFPGKLSKEGEAKEYEARVAESRYKAKALSVLADVRAEYYRLYKADELARLFERNVETMQLLIRSLEARLATGGRMPAAGMGEGGGGMPGGGTGAASGGAGPDVLTMRAELGRMENMLFEQKQERTLAEAELNALLDQPVGTAWGKTVEPDSASIPVGLDELFSLAENNDPLYLA